MRINHHRFDFMHRNSEKPSYYCMLYTTTRTIEVRFELRGIYFEELNPEDSINLGRIRNVELAHQLILKPSQPDRLNFKILHLFTSRTT